MQPDETALGLPAARFHDLRHSFAVNLLSASSPVDFKWVSKWLGHSTYADFLTLVLRTASGVMATEAGIVRLASDGLTNNDNATRLFVSPRTVQTHLTHV